MTERLESIEIDENLKPRVYSYFLQYAEEQKTAAGVSSIMNGMLREVAPYISDDIYERILKMERALVRAIVENWDDSETTIAYTKI